MKKYNQTNSRLVYSTETGRVKENRKGSVLSDKGDGIIRLFRESRKGNGVTLIKGLPGEANLKELAKTLKKKLGVGGSIKEGVIEIQTDQREAIKQYLEHKNYTVKIAGG
ncbi:MAG: translation initiation factor 1 [Cellvibrionaceae bacterium]|jgi:translation initiation factor 1